MKVLNAWILWCDRFDNFVVRERILLFGCLVAGIYLVFDTLFIMPTNKEILRLQEEILTVQKNTDKLNAEKNVFDRVSKNDPDADLKREVLKLKGRLLQLESDLDELSLRLVSADRIPEVLKSVSQQTNKIHLKTIQTLKPQLIDFSGVKRVQLKSLASAVDASMGIDNDTPASMSSQKVYKYGIHIVFEGTFFEILDFLGALEALEWRLYWEGLDYHVMTYPRARVEVEVYTLSMMEGEE